MEPQEPGGQPSSSVDLDAIQARLKTFQTPEVTHNDISVTILYKDLHLTTEHPTTTPVAITLEKQPLRIDEGKIYDWGLLVVDGETDKMQAIAMEAEALKKLPEAKRPRAVLELLRKHIHYAYADVMELVAQQNPELAAWVSTNTGLDAPMKKINLSDVFDKGYGICHHLSVTYLWLAQKAGLQGTLMSSGHQSIRNIDRIDKPGKLFQLTEIGEFTGAHSWNEIRLSDGRWVPIDPSTQLVGDTEEGLRMFKDANYETPAGFGLKFEYGPQWKVQPQTDGDTPMFRPGEQTVTGKYQLLLSSTRPILRLGNARGNIPPTNEPFTGDATLTISATPNRGVLNLGIKNAVVVQNTDA